MEKLTWWWPGYGDGGDRAGFSIFVNPAWVEKVEDIHRPAWEMGVVRIFFREGVTPRWVDVSEGEEEVLRVLELHAPSGVLALEDRILDWGKVALIEDGDGNGRPGARVHTFGMFRNRFRSFQEQWKELNAKQTLDELIS